MTMVYASIDNTCPPGVTLTEAGGPPTGVVGGKGTGNPPWALVAGIKGWAPGINVHKLVSVVTKWCVTVLPGEEGKGTLAAAARGVINDVTGGSRVDLGGDRWTSGGASTVLSGGSAVGSIINLCICMGK